MNSAITITPIDNIKDFAVVNNNLVTTEVYDSDMDVLLIENEKGKTRMTNLMGISLFDDLIVKGKTKYKILHMISK